MPSFTSTQSIHAYDRTLQMLNTSFTLVAISEEDEYKHDSPMMMVRHNANLRRDSFGNQSCKTGLSQLANNYSKDSYSSLTSSPRLGHNDNFRHCAATTSSNNDMAGWGFFIDE
jgi:hypothetical protein